MAFKNTGPDLNRIKAKLAAYKRQQFPIRVGTEAVNFFKRSFKREGFIEKTMKKWQPRKDEANTKRQRKRDGNRATLTKSSRLRKSIRIVQKSPAMVTIGTDVPYAKVHNEGELVSTTQNISQHKRRAHTRKRKGRTENVSAHTVQAHTRRMNFQMPKRQFMGYSSFLERRITLLVAKDIQRLF